MNKTKNTHIRNYPRINLAIKLLWISFSLGILQKLLNNDFVEEVKADGGGLILIIWVSFSAFTFYLILSVSRGKNWARIIMLLLAYFSIAGVFLEFLIFEKHQYGIFQSIAGYSVVMVHLPIMFYALYVFFTGTSSEWFRKNKTE